MRFDDFRQLVERLLREVPPAYLDGVVVVEVSPKAVPHPVRGDVYTLGECIPLEWSGNGANLQSRVVLYHGSFAALARVGGFDWREEAWETLSHELRHHLELRANSRALETYDWAAEQNFSRQEGQPFDPLFYRSGEKIADGVYKVEEDVFIENWEQRRGNPKGLPGGRGEGFEGVWHGKLYHVSLPGGVRSPAFLTLEGLDEPPPGDAVLVVARKPSLGDLWHRPAPAGAVVTVEPVAG